MTTTYPNNPIDETVFDMENGDRQQRHGSWIMPLFAIDFNTSLSWPLHKIRNGPPNNKPHWKTDQLGKSTKQSPELAEQNAPLLHGVPGYGPVVLPGKRTE